jgi:hypothetical protein
MGLDELARAVGMFVGTSPGGTIAATSPRGN